MIPPESALSVKFFLNLLNEALETINMAKAPILRKPPDQRHCDTKNGNNLPLDRIWRGVQTLKQNANEEDLRGPEYAENHPGHIGLAPTRCHDEA